LAAATSYMVEAAKKRETTKKDIAAKFGVSVSTVSKYVDELSRFMPDSGN
jgi:Mn-dependent DtxR family transcriptional regulator